MRAGIRAGCVQLTPMAVCDVLLIAAGECEPGREFGVGRERLADGLGFSKRGQRFKGQEIGNFFSVCVRKGRDALTMEGDQIIKGAVVVAVILGAVVQHGAIGTE